MEAETTSMILPSLMTSRPSLINDFNISLQTIISLSFSSFDSIRMKGTAYEAQGDKLRVGYFFM